jgi:hypothetical protein
MPKSTYTASLKLNNKERFDKLMGVACQADEKIKVVLNFKKDKIEFGQKSNSSKFKLTSGEVDSDLTFEMDPIVKTKCSKLASLKHGSLYVEVENGQLVCVEYGAKPKRKSIETRFVLYSN